MLLRPPEMLASPIPRQKHPMLPAVAASLFPKPSSPALDLAEKTKPAIVPPQALAMEANPNAHLQSLPTEAVLSSNPAPQLNAAQAIVFILDISGSMYEPYAGSTRLAFARQALSRRILALKNGTPFSITLYAQRACSSGPLVAANDATRQAAIRFVMRDVDCGGGTNLPAGFTSAEQLHPGFIVLATDGDLNTTAFKLATDAVNILGPEDHCPNLTIIGIAPRSDTRAEQLLQSLADQQGGTYMPEELSDAKLMTASDTEARTPSAP